MTRILLINANPSPTPERLSTALAEAYASGAAAGGHEVRRVDLASIDFPPVLTTDDVEGEPPASVVASQADFHWAEHVVIVFPLWLAAPPALMKSYFEQLWRYGFSFSRSFKPLLKGRTARLIVTAQIPVFVYHLLFSQGVRGFIRGVLWPAGIKPTRVTILGRVFDAKKEPWFVRVRALGQNAR